MSNTYKQVRGRITERFGTISAFCDAVGMSKQVMSLKLNGKQNFTYDQIVKISDALGIKNREIGQYFFCNESSQK